MLQGEIPAVMRSSSPLLLMNFFFLDTNLKEWDNLITPVAEIIICLLLLIPWCYFMNNSNSKTDTVWNKVLLSPCSVFLCTVSCWQCGDAWSILTCGQPSPSKWGQTIFEIQWPSAGFLHLQSEIQALFKNCRSVWELFQHVKVVVNYIFISIFWHL